MVVVGGKGEVFGDFDVGFCLGGEVVRGLGFGEAGEVGAWVDEVGEDLVEDFDGEGFKFGGGRRCGGRCA